MADTGSPPREPGIEARVARLESDVAHIRIDLGDVKSTLNRLAPIIDEMRGFLSAKLPELATKADLSNLRSETKADLSNLHSETKADLSNLRSETKADLSNLRSETKAEFADIRQQMAELRLEIALRPTRRQSVFDIFAVVGLIGAILTIAARFAH